MIDWASFFDESHPVEGLSISDLMFFTTSVSQPLSRKEIAGIVESQRNPFPAGDPLYENWRPVDPSLWLIPKRPLPASYLEFLTWSNGGEFRTGERWFQFFPARDPRHGVRAMMLSYHVPQYLPGAIPFAFDGCGGFYLFDQRKKARRGEYPIVYSHAGNLGWEADESIRIADSFEAACRGTNKIE